MQNIYEGLGHALLVINVFVVTQELTHAGSDYFTSTYPTCILSEHFLNIIPR